jgi:hypothetical protein
VGPIGAAVSGWAVPDLPDLPDLSLGYVDLVGWAVRTPDILLAARSLLFSDDIH